MKHTDLLLQEIKRHPNHAQRTHAEQQAIAEHATPHLRVGNFEEAIQRGHESVIYGRPITPPVTRR